MSTKMLLNLSSLPDNVKSHIYSYDDTYKQKFNKVLDRINNLQSENWCKYWGQHYDISSCFIHWGNSKYSISTYENKFNLNEMD